MAVVKKLLNVTFISGKNFRLIYASIANEKKIIVRDGFNIFQPGQSNGKSYIVQKLILSISKISERCYFSSRLEYIRNIWLLFFLMKATETMQLLVLRRASFELHYSLNCFIKEIFTFSYIKESKRLNHLDDVYLTIRDLTST